MTEFDLGPDLRPDYPEIHVDHVVLHHVLRQVRAEARPGWAIEFGVATGSTLALIAETLPVIGFDSFKGLPEDWREDFAKGMFADVRPPQEIANSTLVEGWFDETVPGYDWPENVLLVHVDCDLYSSAKTALDALAYSVHAGTYIVFDEFFGYEGAEKHEQLAFEEWIDGLAIERGLSYETVGHGREQWAVRLV